VRTFLLVLPALLSAGCLSVWKTEPVDTGKPIFVFYQDLDGDGWGTAAASINATDGDETQHLTARNSRDCWDGVNPSDAGAAETNAAAAKVTARIGSTCPANLITSGAEPITGYAGAISGGNEFLVFHGAVEQVWADAATRACSPWGWGGALATFNDDGDLDSVKALVTESVWAGWVGIEPDGGTGAKTWKWSDTSTMPIGSGGSLAPCATDLPAHTQAVERLALVKRSATEWCWGGPQDVAAVYPDIRHAHFVCERPVPVADNYQEAIPPTSE
jgi:hypothetical protein